MQNKASDLRTRLEEQCAAWSLPKGLAEDVENHLTPVTFEPGAILFLRGSPADFFFWLLGGFVKLYLPHDDGGRSLVALAGAGDVLGFVNSLAAGGRREQVLEAHALTKCSVGLFPRGRLARLLSQLDSTTVLRLLERLNTTWSSMFEWYAAFMRLPYRDRLLEVFKHLGVRFGVTETRGIMLLPELTHEDLAEMIGSSRPMVSRLIGDMVKEGLLVRGERLHFVLRGDSGLHLENALGNGGNAHKLKSVEALRASV
jgi:CRP/FNR family cyclic AMP-dependent transcriptional regulator